VDEKTNERKGENQKTDLKRKSKKKKKKKKKMRELLRIVNSYLLSVAFVFFVGGEGLSACLAPISPARPTQSCPYD